MNKNDTDHVIVGAKRKVDCPSGVPAKSSVSFVPKLAGEFEVLEPPVKSFSDKKEYRVIQLKNGLTACLISDICLPEKKEYVVAETISESDSDTDTDNSVSWESVSQSSSSEVCDDDALKYKKSKDEVKLAAAALCVGVGSFSDPKEVPGLAHFLEHMVFMGSEKFPQENDFDSYIQKHGGSDNASTDYEMTTFHFECFENHLQTALDKFSLFFISPLMKRDSLSRERESVESEFQMAVPSDENRAEQLLMSLADKSSPAHSFSWGNLVSLRDNISDEDLYIKLHEFRTRHYSAHRMTLAIQARLPLDVLESFVVNCFSNVPNNNLPPQDFSGYTDAMFHTPEFQKLYYLKPVKDMCQVILTWIMPSFLHMYKSKPYEYVSWLIGHEGKGSLLSYLRKRSWALSLEAGTGTSGADFNSMYMAFSVSILLTDSGCEHIDEVIEAVFSYIKLLTHAGPSKQIFDEIQSIQDISFQYDEEEDPSDIVELLAESMQIYPSKDYMTGSELYFEYAPEEITKVLNHLSPTKVNVMILSTSVPKTVQYDKIEPWFKTQYTQMEIPSKWLTSWNAVKPFPCFTLPEPNQFLTEDFTMLPNDFDTTEFPKKIMDTSLIELWYKKDQKFLLPVAYYYYYLFSPYSVESAKNSCMMQIFTFMLNMNLMEEGYPAKLANLSYSISVFERGLAIKVIGYNEKLPKLIRLLSKYLKSCASTFDEVLFEAARSKQKQNIYNAILKPSRLSNDVRSNILQPHYYSLLEKYLEFPNITYNMMKEFAENVLSQLYVQGLIQGNLSSDTAMNSTQILLDELKFQPIITKDCLQVPVNELPKGERCCRVWSLNKENINSIVTNYYQYGPLTLKDNAIVDFIMLVTEEPLFDTLRTKEQLGYSVFSTIRDTYGILGYSITVNTQADKYTTKHIDNRIEDFIKDSHKLLKKMSTKKFMQTKAALIEMKQVVDVDLEDEVDRNWDEIIFCKYMFDRLQQEITAIEDLKISDIRTWWDACNIYSKKNKCRKLSVQVMGHVKGADVVQNIVQLEAEDVPINDVEEDCSKTVVRDDIEMVPVEDTSYKNVDTFIMCSTSGKLSLCFDSDTDEVTTRNKGNNYFITDLKSFKETLKQFPQVGNNKIMSV